MLRRWAMMHWAGLVLATAVTHPFVPLRTISEAELLDLLRIPNTEDQSGRASARRDGWHGVGACGSLVLLSDHHAAPNAVTTERRQILDETARALRHPPALVLGLAHASTALATALGQNETVFARGGSQVWMFTPVGGGDATPMTTGSSVSTSGQGWLGSLLSSVSALFGAGGESTVAGGRALWLSASLSLCLSLCRCASLSRARCLLYT